MRNRLCCEVDFGKQPQAEDRLLQRSDAISGSLFSFISEPRNQSSHRLVTYSTEDLHRAHLYSELRHTSCKNLSLYVMLRSIAVCLACLHQLSGIGTSACQVSCNALILETGCTD